MLAELQSPDASYGEACLIDALMWLVRKRLPVQSAVTLKFPGFEPAKEGEKKSKVDNSGDTEQQSNSRAWRCIARTKTARRVNLPPPAVITVVTAVQSAMSTTPIRFPLEFAELYHQP
jgi:hypothetical protein